MVSEFEKQAVEIPLQILKGIACVESHYHQFAGIRENGTGFPYAGSQTHAGHKAVGIMQILKPQPSEHAIWGWRQNIKEGINILSDKVTAAKKAHIAERKKLNAKRKSAGISTCPIGIPSPLNNEQLIRESIRRYNGGREYQWEPWDAVDCSQGKWVIKPINIGKHGDPSYVEKVLNCKLNYID